MDKNKWIEEKVKEAENMGFDWNEIADDQARKDLGITMDTSKDIREKWSIGDLIEFKITDILANGDYCGGFKSVKIARALRPAILQVFKKYIGKHKGIDLIEAFDNDGHRYQIPRNKNKEWNEWLEIPSDDERSWDAPEFSERIDGAPVKSVIDILLEGLEKENL